MAKRRDRYDKEYTEIGLMISFYRKRQHMSQGELAEKAGISRVYLSRLEAPNVHATPSLATLYDIAKVLGIPMYKLLMTPDCSSAEDGKRREHYDI